MRSMVIVWHKHQAMMNERMGIEQEIGFSSCPNRQGYLVVGGCTLPPVSVPEPCSDRPVDCEFGISHCRCFRLDLTVIMTTPQPAVGVALRPRDTVRLRVDIPPECDL